MELWIFVGGILFLTLYCVIQVPAVLWISKYFELEDDEQVDPTGGVFEEPSSRPHIPDQQYEAIHVPGEDGPPPQSDRTTCAICGAENLPEYNYCQNCVAHL